MSNSEYLKFAQKGIDDKLAMYSKERLFLPYLMLETNEKQKSHTKEALRKRLFDAFPMQVLLNHVDYISQLSPVQKSAIDFYQSYGYGKMNNYLRYGAIRDFIGNSSPENKPEYIQKSTFKSNAASKYISAQLKQIKNTTKETLKRKKSLLDKTISAIKALRNIIINAPRVPAPFHAYRGENDFFIKFTKSDDIYEQLDDKYRMQQISLTVGQTFEMKSFTSFSLAPWVASDFANNATCCLFRLTVSDTVPCLIFVYTEQFTEFEVLVLPGVFKVSKVTFLESPMSTEFKVKLYDIEFVKPIKIRV